MILTNIRLRNFLCYYGDNFIEFKTGLNVIIGDNGSGKSKFFDAIYWVMYDQCFDSDEEEFRTTSQMSEKLISDRALFESEGGQVECSVSLTFYDGKNENTYTLERKLTATKYDDSISYGNKSSEKITERKGVLSAQLIEDEKKIESLKKRILPDNIKPYMWFQGEQINNLIDFKNTNTLSRAINALSDITRFDDIKSITESLLTTVENEKRKKERALSNDKTEKDDIDDQISSKKGTLKEYQIDLQNARKGLIETKETTEDLLSKLEAAEKIRRLDDQRKEKDEELTRTALELDDLRKSLHKKMFTKAWVLKGTEQLFDQFSNKYSNYEKLKLELRDKIQAEKNIKDKLQTRLPINVPKPVYVQRMLKDEHCLVCNRPAKKGTEAYKAIKALVSNSEENLKKLKEEESKRSDYSSTFNSLYQNGLIQNNKISDIDDDINETLTKIDTLFSKKNEL